MTKLSESVFVPQLLQKYQMVPDCLGHGGVLPVGNAILFGGFLHDPGQRSIVGMAHEGAQMMDDVMVESAREPTDKRAFRRIIGRCREDVIHAVVELTTIRGEVSAVDGVRRLEYERYAQSDDQMDQEERSGDQQQRFSQHQHRQDKHVSNVEGLAPKEDRVFAGSVFGALQIVVLWGEKALEVPDEYVVERKQSVKQQHVDVLKPVQWRPGLMGRKAKNAASRKRIVFTVEIDAGVMAPMMEDAPHVGADSAQIEDVVQGFVDDRPGRDGVVIAVVRDVQQEECLRESP